MQVNVKRISGRGRSRQDRRAQSVHVPASCELAKLAPEVRRRIEQDPCDAMLRFLPRVLTELN